MEYQRFSVGFGSQSPFVTIHPDGRIYVTAPSFLTIDEAIKLGQTLLEVAKRVADNATREAYG